MQFNARALILVAVLCLVMILDFAQASLTEDCTEIDLVFEDLPAKLTPAERARRREEEFMRALGQVDRCQSAQRNSDAGNSANNGTGSGTGSGSGNGNSDGSGNGSGEQGSGSQNGTEAQGANSGPSGQGTEQSPGASQQGQSTGSAQSRTSMAAGDISGTEPTAMSGTQASNGRQNGQSSHPSSATTANSGTSRSDDGNLSYGTDGDDTSRPSAGRGIRTPSDIPPVDNDDALARQLRRAAETESDPEVRARLWNEYRRFKGLPTVDE